MITDQIPSLGCSSALASAAPPLLGLGAARQSYPDSKQPSPGRAGTIIGAGSLGPLIHCPSLERNGVSMVPPPGPTRVGPTRVWQQIQRLKVAVSLDLRIHIPPMKDALEAFKLQCLSPCLQARSQTLSKSCEFKKLLWPRRAFFDPIDVRGVLQEAHTRASISKHWLVISRR